jgi:hypothetical protein
MRDPIERLESQYTYSYARWITDSLENRIKHGHIIHVSRYAHQLDQYSSKFNPEYFLLLDFDDLKQNPEEVLKRTCEFLNIDTDFTFSGLGEVYNKSVGKVITRPVDRLYQKHPRLKAFSKLFPKHLKQSVARLVFRKRIAGNFKMTDSQRAYVFESLKDDMIRLHEKYGIDVSKWNF